MSWTNWSGRLRAEPARIVAVSHEAEVVAAVGAAAAAGERVRCVGAGHSHSALVPTEGVLLDLSALTGVVAIDSERMSATVRAGTRISALGAPLLAAGVALPNQGDIDGQAIAGAVATGTHGTGRTLKNLSAGVLAARLVLADGSCVDCDRSREADLFDAARLSLGAVGVVTELTLGVRDAYRLDETMWLEDVDAVLDRIDALTRATRHFEFFWRPASRRAACKALAETAEAAVHPVGPEGDRLAWSHEVLANERNDKHTEMEYSVPAATGPACFRALRELLARDFADLRWPLEYRTLAADDVWLSTAYERETVTLSVHQGIDADDGPLFEACEEVFRSFSGRPHWGKRHGLSGDALAACHPRFEDWWRVRDTFDPGGRFLNEHLDSLRS